MAQYLTSTYYYVCNRVRTNTESTEGKTLGKGVEYTYEKKPHSSKQNSENFSKMKLGQELSFSGSDKVVPNF